ncbi:MAG: hypothetical protein CVT83_01445 [Alphaproteobacteria bacterium HGW-Alphaproteobacteria-5]|nr:MAG: hypothetical protein CVT83_01445 [Alphaproteobacteria bacterium HGW-Alphaproteobacteria-5]
MRITRYTLPLLSLLQGFGLNRHIRGWDRTLSWLFPHHAGNVRYLKTTRWGLTYLANPANYVDWDILCHGSYEAGDLAFLRRLGRPGSLCLDAGANIGHHALFFGSLGWVVHAFEPNPRLWPEFDAKISASGLRNVTLHKVALGLDDAILEFELENRSNSGTGRFVEGAIKTEGSVPAGRLPVRNGGRYLSERGIGRVDVIKMDIQGFEPEALAGLNQTIRRDLPLICIEISPDNIAKLKSFDGFKACLPDGYSFARLRVRKAGPFRWTKIESYSGEGFSALYGNLFCIPGGKAL